MLALDHVAPDFSLPATNGGTIRLSEFVGKNVVLYFYPKDCTPGCTQEGKDFSEHYRKFASVDTVIFGVSRDTVKLHTKFKTEQQFPFELLSDLDGRVCTLYGVLQEKTVENKKLISVVRSTFLIDRKGILRREWRGVKVPNHAQVVLQAVAELGLSSE